MNRLAMVLFLPLALASGAATLVVPSSPLNFVYQKGGNPPAIQQVPIQSIGDPIRFTSAVSSDANWLRLGVDSGTTPGFVTISADPNGLAVGTYTGLLSIFAQGATNNPQLVSIKLQILQGVSLSVSATQLNFTYRTGSSQPPPQEVTVSSSAGSLDYTAVATSKGNWLTATAAGSTPGTVVIRTIPDALATGVYTGTVVVTAQGTVNDAITISVNLNVSPMQSLVVATTPLVFNFDSAATAPLAQTLLVGANVSALGFTIAAASGAPWLTIPTTAGVAPAVVEVRANPAGLAAGTYNSSVFVTSFGAVNSPVVVPVTMIIAGSTPVVAIGGIVNAASASTAGVAPGSLIALYGSRFGTNPKVEVNGLNAPIVFASDGQINAQAPYETAVGDASVVVVANGVRSKPATMAVVAVAPGLFPVVQNADYSINRFSDPAKVGTYITAYLTGQGELDIPVATGAAAPSLPLSRPKAPVTATLGGVAASIYFAGLTPGLIGVCQVDVLVPDIPAGEAQFIVKIGAIASNTALIIVSR